jgi:predicted MFS family arabinose efflux permease
VAVGSIVAVSAFVVLGGLAPALWWLAAAMTGVGLANGVLNVVFQALVLVRTQDAVRGRVSAALMGAIQAGTVAGMGFGAVVGARTDPRTAFVGAGLAGLVVCAGLGAAVARALSEPAESQVRKRRGGGPA